MIANKILNCKIHDNSEINKENNKIFFVERLTDILLVFSIIGIFFNFVFLSYYHKIDWPIITFFLPKDLFANDFTRMIEVSSNLDPYSIMRNIFPDDSNPYFILSYVYFYLISLFSKKISVQIIYFIYVLLFVVSFAFINLKYFSIKKYGFKPFFIVTFLSYPFLYLIDRGNIESLLFIFLYFGLFFYYKKQNLFFSSLFLILATSFKPYFGIFFILYIFDKNFKAFFYSLISGILLILLCFKILKGDINYNIIGFLNELNLAQDCSQLYNCLNLSLKFPFLYGSQISYNIFCLILFSITIFFQYKLKFKRWQILTLFCLLIYFIPTLSNLYKLITLFIPIYYFIDDIKDESIKSIKFYSLIFGLLLSGVGLGNGFQIFFIKFLTIFLYLRIIWDRKNEKNKLNLNN